MVGIAYISRAHDTADLLHRVEVGAETTVHGEDLFVNNGGNWQAVEAIGKGLPQLDVVPAFAFVVKAVDTIDAGAFVISSEDEEVLRILDLVCQKQADSLERLLASINIVAEEEVVGLRRETAIFEQTQ